MANDDPESQNTTLTQKKNDSRTRLCLDTRKQKSTVCSAFVDAVHPRWRLQARVRLSKCDAAFMLVGATAKRLFRGENTL